MENRTTVDKLKVVREITQNAEVKQLCNILIDHLMTTDRSDMQMGFVPATKDSSGDPQ